MRAKSDREVFDLTQIPFEAEKRVGVIFREGEIKYDRNNWRNGLNDISYQLERANHALKHLKIYVHWLEHGEYLGEFKDGKPEDDLAKVLWFCATQMEIERLEGIKKPYHGIIEEEAQEEKIPLEQEPEENKPEKTIGKVNAFTRLLRG